PGASEPPEEPGEGPVETVEPLHRRHVHQHAPLRDQVQAQLAGQGEGLGRFGPLLQPDVPEACRSRLAALEQTKGENYVLRIYDWCGFGFAGDSDPLKPNSREEGLEILRALQSGASWEEATGRRGK
ncbi:MAG: hypothetical protein NTW95_12410, partial [Candidatus Aminicenantes bacterium]|nr:hypothetical protein [Candidatus Aminicenantes bacterium]